MSDATIRVAEDADVEAVRDLFVRVYGDDFVHPEVYDAAWLKKSVYDDNTDFLIAEAGGAVVATASAMLAAGGMNDLIGELGRLVAENTRRARGAAETLCARLIGNMRERVQFGFGEVRTVHRGSQRIAAKLGWTPVGYLPMKYQLGRRESPLLYASLFGFARELRRNNPRVIPEAATLAQTALKKIDLPADAIVEDESEGYPTGQAFAVERLEQKGVTSLLRIERGRVRQREVFGHFGLANGFFRVANTNSHYLVARDGDAVLGAIGFTWDPLDRKIRLLELIEFDDAVKGWLLASVDRIAAEEFDAAYVEADVSAYSPRIQRTLERLGFVAAAYCPSMVFDNVERLDVLRMAKVRVPYEPGSQRLLEGGARIRAIVETSLEDRMVGMEICGAARQCSIFEGMPEGERLHLARIATVREEPAGTRLLRRGDPPDRLYVLAEGEAEARADGTLLGRLGAGDVFGEMGMVDKAPCSADVVLAAPSRVVEFLIPRLERLMEARPRLGYVVARNLARNLSAKLRGRKRDASSETIRP